MLCSTVKLADRKQQAKQEIAPKRNKSKMLEQKLFTTSDYYHSYTFRWDKPKKYDNCDTVQYLTINNIIPPDNIQTFNTGSSIEKWSKKRPRLKSTKQKIQNPPPKGSDLASDDNFDVTPLIDELSQENEEDEACPSETVTSSDSSEIDPDVKRLLSVTRDSEDRSEKGEDDLRRRRRRKHRHKRKDKHAGNEDNDHSKGKTTRRKTKTIKFSLSKPPSPSTTQVIRVDVTSNYSFEEVEPIETNRTDTNVSDCSKGCGKRIRSRNDLKMALSKVEGGHFGSGGSEEIKIQCNKLVLSSRKLTFP